MNLSEDSEEIEPKIKMASVDLKKPRIGSERGSFLETWLILSDLQAFNNNW